MDDAIFGVAAARHQRGDARAERMARRVRAEDDDLAGEFEAGQIGSAGRGRVGALALKHVRPIDAGGGDAHENLALAGLR